MKLSTPNLIRILTAVLTPASAALTAWGAKHGLQLPNGEVVTVGVGASAAVLLMGFHWLQKHTAVEKLDADVLSIEKRLVGAVALAVPQSVPAMADIESVLSAHTDQIVQAIGSAVHASPTVEQVAEQILQIAAKPQPAPQPQPPAPPVAPIA